MKTITFIGNGNMALSIAKGLKGLYKIEVVGRDLKKLDDFENSIGVKIEKYMLDNFNIQDKTLILCVKPANIKEVSKRLNSSTKARVIYSVLAGVCIEKISQNLNADAIVRAMPNLAASVNKSMTTLTGNIEFKKEAQDIFNSIGETRWLETQKELDIATALAGSGPAYLSLVAEALTDGAVIEGLKREDAVFLTQGLFDGFSEIIKTKHTSILKDEVMSPGGTTAAGYCVIENAGVRFAFINAIKQAYKKAKELSSTE